VKIVVLLVADKFPALWEPEAVFPFSEPTATSPYPEYDESSSKPRRIYSSYVLIFHPYNRRMDVPRSLLPLYFVAIVLYEIIHLSMHGKYPTHLILFGFSNLILIFDEE
jgi:hypothetical protein